MDTILAAKIFKCIFVNENIRISIRISLKYVPKDLIDNKLTLVKVMAWRRTGSVYWRIYAALGGAELNTTNPSTPNDRWN